MNYLVVHGDASLQLLSGRTVVPADEVSAFQSAAGCAQAMTALNARRTEAFESALQAARVQGFEQGLAQGREKAAADFGAAAAQLALDSRQHQADTCAAVGTLALAVVRKLASRLGADALVPELVEQAVASVAPEPVQAVRVHPWAAEAARQRLAELRVLGIAVVPDETLDVFACVMDTQHGSHLAGLDDQLDAIGRALGAAVARPLPAPAA